VPEAFGSWRHLFKVTYDRGRGSVAGQKIDWKTRLRPSVLVSIVTSLYLYEGKKK
jgi:hypothetical protein